MARIAALERLVADFAAQRPMRCTSLIVSLLGDVVSVHGGVIWLGSLVAALGLLGIDERLVRTSTFRLVQDGWLSSDRTGRRSFYRFTDYGRHEYERAARRIYALAPPPWDGDWTLLLPVGVPEDAREAFRATVAWQGFGGLGSNVYAHPGSDAGALTEALQELHIDDRVVVMRATIDATQSQRLVRDLLWKSWRLEELGDRYTAFGERFRPVLRALARAREVTPEQHFMVRLLLIHEYRRILLHDPDLPLELLPRDWPGQRARALAAELYAAVGAGSVRYIRSALESADAGMPEAAPAWQERFSRS